MKSRIFYATTKWTPGLSTNFTRQTRNFRCHALHFLSFVGKLIFVRNTSHTGPRELNYVNLPINDEKRRAGHIKFLVRLEKLVERRGVRFGVALKCAISYNKATTDVNAPPGFNPDLSLNVCKTVILEFCQQKTLTVNLRMIPYPNLSFLRRELKNDHFTDIQTSLWVRFHFPCQATKAGRAKCKINVFGFSYPFSSENCSLGLCPR